MSPWTVLLWAFVAAIALALTLSAAIAVVVAWCTVRDTIADRRRDRATVTAFREQLDEMDEGTW